MLNLAYLGRVVGDEQDSTHNSQRLDGRMEAEGWMLLMNFLERLALLKRFYKMFN